jgi:hypothetical protein
MNSPGVDLKFCPVPRERRKARTESAVATVLLKWFRKEAYSINLQLVSLNGFCHQFPWAGKNDIKRLINGSTHPP